MIDLIYFQLLSALGIDDKVGNFQVGKDFDALVINLAPNEGHLDAWPDETIENRFSKWIYLGDDRSISQVYVQGVEVKQHAKQTLISKRQNGK